MTDGMHGVKLHGNDFKHIEVRARIKITRARVIGDHLVTNQMKKTDTLTSLHNYLEYHSDS